MMILSRSSELLGCTQVLSYLIYAGFVSTTFLRKLITKLTIFATFAFRKYGRKCSIFVVQREGIENERPSHEVRTLHVVLSSPICLRWYPSRQLTTCLMNSLNNTTTPLSRNHYGMHSIWFIPGHITGRS